MLRHSAFFFNNNTRCGWRLSAQASLAATSARSSPCTATTSSSSVLAVALEDEALARKGADPSDGSAEEIGADLDGIHRDLRNRAHSEHVPVARARALYALWPLSLSPSFSLSSAVQATESAGSALTTPVSASSWRRSETALAARRVLRSRPSLCVRARPLSCRAPAALALATRRALCSRSSSLVAFPPSSFLAPLLTRCPRPLACRALQDGRG